MSERYYYNPKENLQNIFATYYQNFQSCFYSCNFDSTLEKRLQKEIVPFMYVISDIAAVTSNCDVYCRQMILKSFKEIKFHNQPAIQNEVAHLFGKRIDFYTDFIRGKQPRYEWLFFEKPQGSDNAILRCCAAFGDIMCNPYCVDDYDNAPIQLHSFSEIEGFAEIMNDFISEVANFYNTLYTTYNNKSLFNEERQMEEILTRYKQEEKNKKELRGCLFFFLGLILLFIILCIIFK